MRIEAERYTGLIGLADALARATSIRTVNAVLTAHAPQIVGGFAAVLFTRSPNGGGELCRFDPIAQGPGLAPVRAFSTVWPLERAGLVSRSSPDLPHYRPLWDALEALSPGAIVHHPVGANTLLVIVYEDEDRTMTGHDWMVLGSLAEQTSAARERIEALARVRELSLADLATGIGNRRLIEVALQQRFADAERGEPLSVVSLRPTTPSDAAGEAVAPDLRKVATLLRARHRASDVSAHFGEGIFVVVLPSSTEAGAMAFLRRVLSAIDGITFRWAVAQHDVTYRTSSELLAAVLSRVGAAPVTGGAGSAFLDPAASQPVSH